MSTPPPETKQAAEFLGHFFAAGGGRYCDLVSFHAYTPQASEKVVPIVKNIRQQMEEHGQGGKELWVTEGGWAKDERLPDPNLQAGFVAKDYLLLWSSGIARFYWYGWDYNPWGTLWDPANGIHKSGVAYTTVEKWLVGSHMPRPCASQAEKTWTCELQLASGRQALVVWNSERLATFRIPEGFREGENVEGIAFTVSGSVNIGPEPILLTHR